MPDTRFPSRIALPVAWGEMDAFQHVNNVTYFRWFESGRIHYLQQVGYLDHMKRTGLGPILASARCRFRAPLAWPDTVTVQTGVEDLGPDRFTMRFRVVSGELGVLAAEGDGLMVSYDYGQGCKCPLPAAVRAAILAWEARED